MLTRYIADGRDRKEASKILKNMIPTLVGGLISGNPAVHEQSSSALELIMKNEGSMFEELLPIFRSSSYTTVEALLQLTSQVVKSAQTDTSLPLSSIAEQLLLSSNESMGNVRTFAIEALLCMYKRTGQELLDFIEENAALIQQSELKGLHAKLQTTLVDADNNLCILNDLSSNDSSPRSLVAFSSDESINDSVVWQDEEDPMRQAVDNDMAGMIEKECPAVQIYTDRELEQEMDSIEKSLASVKVAWDRRMSALRRLCGLIRGSTAGQRSNFPRLCRCLSGPLAVQLGEHRSAIVKLSCAVAGELVAGLVELGSSAGDKAAAQLADSALPVLLKQATLSVAVMAGAADHACRRIVGSAPRSKGFPSLLARLLKECRSRSKDTREGCVRYLRIALLSWDVTIFHRNSNTSCASGSGSNTWADEVSTVVVAALNDADSRVRENARSLYVRHPSFP